ncbi:hypothetical protein AALP_AA4G004300 [Arabis alpina]|uniref:Uncharacterized protein n=1 Tax=Arabis alpina TaxID=50452 RepID=A0A087H090_ARAAL|nr:hypothetical protein AALP_AA4G004300 [Arabis alpina]
MASACVKSSSLSPSYGWTTTPRMSITGPEKNQDPVEDPFEFCLEEDPVTMLSADELFSDGKLVPLKFSGGPKPTVTEPTQPEVLKSCKRLEIEISDLFSPKAPRCTTRWRELLGLKKAQAQDSVKNTKTSSFKQFLHRGNNNKETDSSTSSSSRLSLSSSSSSSHEELPRLSLDLDKPSPNPFAPSRTHQRNNLPNQSRIRLAKPRRNLSSSDGSSSSSTVTADSPRLNASGKLVFHGLERSSSSPGSFTGGPRMKQNHGMPRSYSANVRITPVLNVPVSSLKSGLFFGQLFASSSPVNKSQLQSNGKNRSNRTRLEPKCEH